MSEKWHVAVASARCVDREGARRRANRLPPGLPPARCSVSSWRGWVIFSNLRYARCTRRLFSHVIARALPDYDAAELLLRYRRVRQVRRFAGGEIRRVFVLSRVTLGADVAVTSVALNAAKARFPDAEICLVGPAKNAEMFAADTKITSIPVVYGRSSLLRERLAAALELHTIVDGPGTLVIDPDSRLTQLGLIPICDDARYFFFESRAFGGELDAALPELTSEWLSEVFDSERTRPYVAPVAQPKIADVTVSFGVGENADKRIPGDFEYEVLLSLLRGNRPVLIDRGAGGEEAERVNALVERLGVSRAVACPRWDLCILRKPYPTEQTVCRLRFSGPACGGRRGCAACFGVHRIRMRAHVCAVAAERLYGSRDPDQ